jgi:hypothetical protein
MSENLNNEQPTSSENSVVLLDDEDNFQEVNYEESPNSELNVENTPVIEIEKSNNENIVESKNFVSDEINYKEDSDAFDVIIVGAGISGLSAAYTLKKSLKDMKLLIVEAKDRVGGNFKILINIFYTIS